MNGLDLVDRLMELGIVDGRESEVRLWLTHDDKAAILNAVEQHGSRALENVTKGGVILYSRELRQAVGHDANFLERVFFSTAPPPRSALMKYAGPTKILLVLADHSFPESTVPAIDSYSPFVDRAKYQTPGQSIAANSVVYGSEFTATMQLRTPLRILEQHGRIERCDTAALPLLIKEAWEGIWVPKVASFRDMGIDIDDIPDGTMASEFGQIEVNGGDLLRVMLLVKRIARCDADRQERCELMHAAAELYGVGGHSFGAFMNRWGGPAALIDLDT